MVCTRVQEAGHGDDGESGMQAEVGAFLGRGKQEDDGEEAGAGGADGEEEDEQPAQVLAPRILADVFDGRAGNAAAK